MLVQASNGHTYTVLGASSSPELRHVRLHQDILGGFWLSSDGKRAVVHFVYAAELPLETLEEIAARYVAATSGETT